MVPEVDRRSSVALQVQRIFRGRYSARPCPRVRRRSDPDFVTVVAKSAIAAALLCERHSRDDPISVHFGFVALGVRLLRLLAPGWAGAI